MFIDLQWNFFNYQCLVSFFVDKKQTFYYHELSTKKDEKSFPQARHNSYGQKWEKTINSRSC